ncbi:hypothetical protein JCM19992_03240 [Thermostilla marina]
MVVRFLCPSGHRLKAPPWMIGAEVRCPRCGQATVVPKRTAAGAHPRPSASHDDSAPAGNALANEQAASSTALSCAPAASDEGTVILSVDDLIDSSVSEDADSASEAPAGPTRDGRTGQSEASGKNGNTPPPLPGRPPPLPKQREKPAASKNALPETEPAVSADEGTPIDAELVEELPEHDRPSPSRPRSLWQWGVLWDLGQVDPEKLPRRDAESIRNARLLEGVTAAIVLATSVPIWWAGERAPWAFALGALVWIELAVVLMGVVFPDWSTMRRQLYVFGIAAAGLASLAAFVQFAPHGRELPLGLDAYRASAGRVAATLMLLQLLAAVVCGWYAAGWKRRDMLRRHKVRRSKRR